MKVEAAERPQHDEGGNAKECPRGAGEPRDFGGQRAEMVVAGVAVVGSEKAARGIFGIYRTIFCHCRHPACARAESRGTRWTTIISKKARRWRTPLKPVVLLGRLQNQPRLRRQPKPRRPFEQEAKRGVTYRPEQE